MVHEHPGVYSSYDASSVIGGKKTARILGAAAVSTTGTANEVVTLTSYAEGVSAFGGCLPLLIQFPIIIILYEVIRNPLQYVAGYSTTLINSIKNVLCYNSVSGWNLTSSITNYAQTASVNGITDLDMVAG